MSDNTIEDIKSKIKHNVIYLHDFEDIDTMLLFDMKDHYLVFDNIMLKNYFTSHTNRNVINCNSSYKRFANDMESFSSDTIFNNINFCNDFDILNIVMNTNNLMID